MTATSSSSTTYINPALDIATLTAQAIQDRFTQADAALVARQTNIAAEQTRATLAENAEVTRATNAETLEIAARIAADASEASTRAAADTAEITARTAAVLNEAYIRGGMDAVQQTEINALQAVSSITGGTAFTLLTRNAGAAAIASIGGDGTTTTITTSGLHGLTDGDYVTVSGTVHYNGDSAAINVLSTNQFTYLSSVNNVTETTGFVATKRLFVASTSQFAANYRVTITNDAGDLHKTAIAVIPTSGQITLVDPVPTTWTLTSRASTGKIVGLTIPEVDLASQWTHYGNGVVPTLPRALKWAARDQFVVDAYGATGVGSAVDDTLAIQAAFDACIANGGGEVVFMPNKTYYCNSSTDAQNKSNINVVGASRIKVTGNGATLQKGNIAYGRLLNFRGCSEVEVTGLIFDSVDTIAGQLLVFSNSSQCWAHHNSFLNAVSFGVAIVEDTYRYVNAATDVSFSGSVITKVSGGFLALFAVGQAAIVTSAANAANNSAWPIVSLTDTALTISGTLTTESAGAAVGIARATSCDDVFVTNNLFTNIGTNAITDFPKVTSRNGLFSGNQAYHCGHGASTPAFKTGQGRENCLTVNNILKDSYHGIAITNWESHTLADNIIEDFKGYGLVATASKHPLYTASFRMARAIGNTLSFSPTYAPGTDYPAMVVNGTASGGTVNPGPLEFLGNFIHRTNRAFRVTLDYALRHVRIEDNYIEDVKGNDIIGTPQYQTNTISFNAATGQIRDSLAGMVQYEPGQTVTVTNSASNNGSYPITSVDTAGAYIVVTGTLVNESAGNLISLSVASNPIEAVLRENTWVLNLLTDTATTTSGNATLTAVATPSQWANGMYLKGTNIPADTYIVSGAGTTSMVMSRNATGSASGVAIRGQRNLKTMFASDAGKVQKNDWTRFGWWCMQIQGSTVTVSENTFIEPAWMGTPATGPIYLLANGTYTITDNNLDNGIEGQANFLIRDGGVAGATIKERRNILSPATVPVLYLPLVATLSYDNAVTAFGTRETYGAAAWPNGTVLAVGDKRWNTAPAAAGTMGWVCVGAGTVGSGAVVKTFGTIAA